MVTLTDMTYVLMTFFVLLLSMSSMDSKAFSESFGSLNQGFGVLEFPGQQKLHSLPSTVDINTIKIISVATLTRALQTQRPSQGGIDVQTLANEYFDIRDTPRGITIALKSDLFFDSGSAHLRPGMQTVLSRIAKVLHGTEYHLSVEGHTDPNGAMDENLRLSLQRAQAVLDYFVYVADMSPKRFSVAGYGPLVPRAVNASEYGRARNRRVEIVLLKDKI